jgi:hypothetical protein
MLGIRLRVSHNTILLPRAVTGIHEHLRAVVEKVAPAELSKSVESTNAAVGMEYDHANYTRVMTQSYVCPFSVNVKAERDYLLLDPAAFKEHVRRWIGLVSDGFVGISDLRTPAFTAILDESDNDKCLCDLDVDLVFCFTAV